MRWDGGPGALSGQDVLLAGETYPELDLTGLGDVTDDKLEVVLDAISEAEAEGYELSNVLELNGGGYSPPARLAPSAELALPNEVARDAVRRGDFETAIRARIGANEHTNRAAVELAGSIRDPLAGTWTSRCGPSDDLGRCSSPHHDASCHVVAESAASNGTPDEVRAWNAAIASRAGSRGASGVTAWDAVRASAGLGNLRCQQLYGDPVERTGVPMNSYAAGTDVAAWKTRLGLDDGTLSPGGGPRSAASTWRCRSRSTSAVPVRRLGGFPECAGTRG